jgi:hypothetical protein
MTENQLQNRSYSASADEREELIMVKPSGTIGAPRTAAAAIACGEAAEMAVSGG